MTACTAPPNGYDLAFMRWFHRYGWQVRIDQCGHGVPTVWTFGDTHCPFKVTNGMVKRLAGNRMLVRDIIEHEGTEEIWTNPE